jgi:prolyl 4-hydroxylase
MATQTVTRARALFQSGQPQSAMNLLGEAARANDPDALDFLARLCVTGDIVQRDLRLARDLFRRSAEAGSRDGAASYRAFLANGTGGERDWQQALKQLKLAASTDAGARAELKLIQGMSIADDGAPQGDFVGEPLSSEPKVTRFPALFSDAECDFLVQAAAATLMPSVVVDPRTGEQRPNPVRTSDAAGFPLVQERPAIHALNRRLAAASGTEVSQGEPLQILRYRAGQEYKPHFDALPDAANQRVLTFLVYLNDGFEGGETRFLSTGLEVTARKGDGLLFRNASDDGRPDPKSQHAGLPVTSGEKLLASRWIRAHPLEY